VFNANTGREIDAAFAAMVRERPDALFVSSSPFMVGQRVQLVQLAAFHHMPSSLESRWCFSALSSGRLGFAHGRPAARTNFGILTVIALAISVGPATWAMGAVLPPGEAPPINPNLQPHLSEKCIGRWAWSITSRTRSIAVSNE
jgi:hypothetical protein